MNYFKIENRKIGDEFPTYFIADIAANHDGDLKRAIDLIHLAAESGADVAKFQHFKAKKIVSDSGFKNLNNKFSHQATWKKSIFEVYEDASVPDDWNRTLQSECKKAGIHFFSSPYDFQAVDELNNLNVPAHKIGSGDITWHEMIDYISDSNKPVFIATGASSITEVEYAVNILDTKNIPICLMQCNTNYTSSLENFKYIHLNVLRSYKKKFPHVHLGLSDHTPGHTTVLGAVTLGARVIEKHFTDDNSRVGPDHLFSLNPKSWSEMVNATRELELSLGNDIKKVEDNENETVVLQRRCARLSIDLSAGEKITNEHIEFLRPAPKDSIPPYKCKEILGKKIIYSKKAGDYLRYEDFEK